MFFMIFRIARISALRKGEGVCLHSASRVSNPDSHRLTVAESLNSTARHIVATKNEFLEILEVLEIMEVLVILEKLGNLAKTWRKTWPNAFLCLAHRKQQCEGLL